MINKWKKGREYNLIEKESFDRTVELCHSTESMIESLVGIEKDRRPFTNEQIANKSFKNFRLYYTFLSQVLPKSDYKEFCRNVNPFDGETFAVLVVYVAMSRGCKEMSYDIVKEGYDMLVDIWRDYFEYKDIFDFDRIWNFENLDKELIEKDKEIIQKEVDEKYIKKITKSK